MTLSQPSSRTREAGQLSSRTREADQLSSRTREARVGISREPASESTAGAIEDLAALRVWLRLLACANLVEGQLRTQLRDRFDTTLARFDVLAQLDAAARDSVPGLTMSELSRRLMVTNGNVTPLIERLVSEKLVNRVTSPKDRRSQIVRLTSAGKRSFDAMTPAHREWVNALFSGLSRDDREALFELLGKLRNSIRESLRVEGDDTEVEARS